MTIFKPEPGDSVASIACVGPLDVSEEAEPPTGTRTNGKGNGKMPPSTLLKA